MSKDTGGGQQAAAADGPATSSSLVTSLYNDLRRMARRERSRSGSPPTLQTTALIHEAYLKLQRSGSVWNDRHHFMRAAAAAMRQVLVDAARARLSLKRGAGERPLELEEGQAGDVQQMPDAIVVNLGDALERLALLNPRLAQVVECRFFAGYTEEETAQALEVTSRTVERDWVKARAWLYRELNPEG
jgi:RNA polymerase sigma factor (TIGR02999 family)